MEFQAKRAAGEWFTTIKKTLKLIHDPAALRRFHVTISPGAPVLQEDPETSELRWYSEEARKLQEFWTLLVELAAARAWSQCQYAHCLPNAFAVALHPNTLVADRSLREQRRTWLAVLQAERLVANGGLEAGDQQLVKQLLVDIAWNRLQVAREIYLVGSEAGWSSQNPEVREQARLLCSGPANTKYGCEDVFAHLVSVGRASNMTVAMNKLSALVLWYAFLFYPKTLSLSLSLTLSL